jgi:hypothetical protein
MRRIARRTMRANKFNDVWRIVQWEGGSVYFRGSAYAVICSASMSRL